MMDVLVGGEVFQNMQQQDEKARASADETAMRMKRGIRVGMLETRFRNAMKKTGNGSGGKSG
jgi:hypothetical protein